MGSKQGKIRAVIPSDVSKSNDIKLPVPKKIITTTDRSQVVKTDDDINDKFPSKQSNRTVEKGTSFDEVGSKRMHEANEERFPLQEIQSNRSTSSTEKHTIHDELPSERMDESVESGSERSHKVNAEYCLTNDIRTQQSDKENMQPIALPPIIDLTPVDTKAFSPTICQQRQAAIDNMSYRRAIDQWQPKSIEQLINLINKLSVNQNDIDQAWIIFYWISKTIRYDTTAYFSNNIGSEASTKVFLSRKAVCDGYSTLYADLCNRIGLQCRKVRGYGKGFGLNLRQTSFAKMNHAWNILTLKNEHSYFIESTWGSGHLDASTLKYKAELESHYFLCRPEHMIYGHLPEDSQSQLLEHPLTMEQYLMLPHTDESFFEFNLSIVSPAYVHKINFETGQSYGEVLITTPIKNVELSGSLHDESDTMVDGGDCVYFDRNQNLWRCRFAPQKVGNHTVLIFCCEKSDAKNWTSSCVVEFTFDIDHFPAMPISYPVTWPRFFDYDLEIIKPVNTCYIDLPSDKTTWYCEILVRSPDNVYLSAKIEDSVNGKSVKNGSLVNFNAQESLWQCLFAPPTSTASYKLTIFARRASDTEYNCVTEFELQQVPRPILHEYMQFPLTYGSFQEAKCQLFEPFKGTLKRGSKIQFCCRIPGAHEVNITVDGQWLTGDSTSYLDKNYIYQREIQVGRKEVAVWVKFDKQKSSYTGLLKYLVK